MTARLVPAARAVILSVALSMLLVACASKINQDNFSRIHTGMTMEQVQALLGKPTGSSSMALGGFSGTSATWKGSDGTITVQFLNDQVQAKQFSKP
ncbi:MAG TPA: outer membrane protein assembly factor BamE [Gammaproteobacteria bacterium]|nr:outer membrane protein assembly factor BamE [Gammaproteobacteria bacterium]